MDRVIGQCRMVGLLLMYVGGGVVCVSICSSFSNIMSFGCRSIISSGTEIWYLVRLTYLDGFESK